MTEFWAALVGAVVGALASGAISYFLQRAAFHEQKRDREERTREDRRALGHSLFFKVHSIANTLGHIKKHVEECRNRAVAEGDQEAPPVTYLLPILNVGDAVHLRAEEMAMLLSTREDDVFNRVLEIAPIHNSILPVWQHYIALRNELSQATTGIDLSTGVGQSEFAPNSLAAVKFFEANMIAGQLIERASRDEADATKALNLIVQVLNDKVGTGIKVEPKA